MTGQYGSCLQLQAGWEEDDGQLLSPQTCELAEAVHLWSGMCLAAVLITARSSHRLPITALQRAFTAPCNPGPRLWCSCGAAANTSPIFLLAFMWQGERVQPPSGGAADLPAEEWPRVPQLQGRAACGVGCLAAIVGENSSSILLPVATAWHILVLHRLIAIKAANNWSKQDTLVLWMFWQESFVGNKWKLHKWKGNPLARQVQSLLLSLLKLNTTSV